MDKPNKPASPPGPVPPEQSPQDELQLPARPVRLNHAAFPTESIQTTHRFYSEVLGLPLADAVVVDSSTAPDLRDRNTLHVFYALSDSEYLAFFETDGVAINPNADGSPMWMRHIALDVPDRQALEHWRKHLRAADVPCSDVIIHGENWHSIYFPDPNGLVIEFTWQRRPLGAEDATNAEALVAAWTSSREARSRKDSQH